MKLNEIVTVQTSDVNAEQLDEVSLRQLAAAGALGFGLGAAGTGAAIHHYTEPTTQQATHRVQQAQPQARQQQAQPQRVASYEDRVIELTQKVLEKYHHNITPTKAEHIVRAAIKHETAHFKAEDVLAMIGVESSFQEKKHGHLVKSKLHHDPAVGLTQIRPGKWNLKLSDLSTPEKQIKTSYDILEKTRRMVGDNKDAVFHAYNVGVVNYKTGRLLNPAYPQKIRREAQRYMM